MKKIKLEIAGLSYSQTQSGAYALVLAESNGTRKLPIVIGGFEAQAIAIELEKMTPTRPLTHDLFRTFALALNAEFKEVIIYNLNEGIFYAKLICKHQDQEIELDARTSDAIAIGVRFDCPIYVYDSILDRAGIQLDENSNIQEFTQSPSTSNSSSNPFSNLSLNELEIKMEEAINCEDYEIASQIRDEINRRQE